MNESRARFAEEELHCAVELHDVKKPPRCGAVGKKFLLCLLVCALRKLFPAQEPVFTGKSFTLWIFCSRN